MQSFYIAFLAWYVISFVLVAMVLLASRKPMKAAGTDRRAREG